MSSTSTLASYASLVLPGGAVGAVAAAVSQGNVELTALAILGVVVVGIGGKLVSSNERQVVATTELKNEVVNLERGVQENTSVLRSVLDRLPPKQAG